MEWEFATPQRSGWWWAQRYDRIANEPKGKPEMAEVEFISGRWRARFREEDCWVSWLTEYRWAGPHAEPDEPAP